LTDPISPQSPPTTFPTNSDSASNTLAERTSPSYPAKPMSFGTMLSSQPSSLMITRFTATLSGSTSKEDKTNSKSKELANPIEEESPSIMSNLSDTEPIPTLSSTEDSKPLTLDTHGESSTTSQDGKESELKSHGVNCITPTGTLKSWNLMVT